jgi:gas vesicle protein
MEPESGGWRGRHVAIAFALGALAGAVAALLMAPQTGAKTRRKVRDTMRSARRSLDDLHETVDSSWRRAARAARAALAPALEDPRPDQRS